MINPSFLNDQYWHNLLSQHTGHNKPFTNSANIPISSNLYPSTLFFTAALSTIFTSTTFLWVVLLLLSSSTFFFFGPLPPLLWIDSSWFLFGTSTLISNTKHTSFIISTIGVVFRSFFAIICLKRQFHRGFLAFCQPLNFKTRTLFGFSRRPLE